MIIRILGERQYDVPGERAKGLDELDDRLLAAVESGDTATFVTTLRELLAAVRRLGIPLPEDTLVASELIMPAADSDLAQVRALLRDDGLIPG